MSSSTAVLDDQPSAIIRSTTNVLATFSIGVLQVGLAISLATLLFSGPLTPGAGRAAAGFVLGSAIVSAIVGYSSSMSIVISGAQDTGVIVMAAIAASIATAPDIADNERIPTVIVLIALCTVLTGVVFWVLGHYGLSSFVRFLPYPVISGFTAGTGWLLFRGGIEVMNREAVSLGGIGDLFSWSQAKFLLPGLLLGLIMLVVVRSRLTNTLVGIAILGGAVLFHVVARAGSSFDELESQGWFIGPLESGAAWAPIGPSDVRAADWGALTANALPIVAVVVVSVIGLLLNLSGLETDPDPEIDMNAELQAAGTANVLVGIGGGVIGYHLIGDTLLGRQLGARGRIVPIAIAGLSIIVFLTGPDVIALMPRAIAGGVLTGLGLTLLAEWARTALAQMNRVDDLLSALILVCIAVLGVLPGVGAGVLIAAAMFIIRYSRIDPVRHIFDAAGRSNVDRDPEESGYLNEAAGSILAFELQGYLFFGSITQLRTEIDEEVATVEPQAEGQLRYVIIDLGHVTGIDATAAAGLSQLAAHLTDRGVTPVWSNAKGTIRQDMEREVGVSPLHRDLDHATAWCEEQILSSRVDKKPTTAVDPIQELIARSALAETLEIRELQSGETLIQHGDDGRDMYFIQSGKFTAWIGNDEANMMRIRQMLPGAVLGEIGFCTGATRTATVIADTAAVVQVLSRAQFDELIATEPHQAVEIQQLLLQRMSTRLSATSATVRDLLR